jgi:uncharacterized membrane protein
MNRAPRELAPPDPNASAWPLRLTIVAIALVGLGISIYLTMYELYRITHVWDPLFGSGSHDVLRSRISFAIHRALRIPDAALGIIGYTIEIVLALLGSRRRAFTHPWLVLLFGVAAIPGALTSVALLLLQAKVIHAWCTLCLASAAASLAIVVLVDREVSAALRVLIARRNTA